MGSGASKESCQSGSCGSHAHKDKNIKNLPIPTLDMISNAKLTDPLKVAHVSESQDLWKDSPVLFFIIRRLGCAFCREQALEILKHSDLINNQYGVRIIGIALERRDSEEFVQNFWNGNELWIDEEQVFYKALGSGKVNRAKFFDLFRSDVRKKYRDAKEKVGRYNLKGSGFTLGGVMLVGKNNTGVLYIHRETVFGDKVNMNDLLSACKHANDQ